MSLVGNLHCIYFLQVNVAVLECCLGILCNCAKRAENRYRISKVKLDKVIESFLITMKNIDKIILFSYVSMIYFLPAETITVLPINTGAVKELVDLLEQAASKKDFDANYKFPILGGVNFHGFEIIMAIDAFAHSKEATKKMIDNKVFTHLVNYAKKDINTYHQELVLIAIYKLLSPDTVEAAFTNTGLEPLLHSLTASETDGISYGAIRVNEKLNGFSKLSKCKLTK